MKNQMTPTQDKTDTDEAKANRERPIFKVFQKFLFAVAFGIVVGLLFLFNFESDRSLVGGVAAGIAGALVFVVVGAVFPKFTDRYPLVVIAFAGLLGGIVFGFFLGADLVIMGVGGMITMMVVSWIEKGARN